MTAAPRKPTFRTKLAIGLGYVASSGSHNVVHVLAHCVYNVTLGVSPGLVGVLLCVQRIWDAALDPVAGHVSDNVRSPLGRRRPLMALAIVPLSLSFAALWLFPAGASHRTLFLYLLTASLLFCTARSFYGIPLLGLQAEAADGYHERTRISGFTQIAGAAFAFLPNWLFAFAQSPIFHGVIPGVRTMALALAALFLIAGLAPILLARESFDAKSARAQPRLRLKDSLRLVLGNRPLARILGMQLAASFGYNVVGVLGLYATFYYVYRGDIRHAAVMQGWAGTAFQFAAIGSVLAYRRLSERIGKRATLQIALGVLMAGSAAKFILFQPAHPWLIVFIWAANGAGITGVTTLALSMLADTVDLGELQSGARLEGAYVSIYCLSDKVGYAAGALLSGFILSGIGFDVRLGGAQADETLWLIRLLYAVVPLAGALAAAIVIHGYRLTERDANETRQRLQLARNARSQTVVAGGADPGCPAFDAEARGDHALLPTDPIPISD
ncbi:MAG TPA: MFS transporter [Opitutaceae bacterium]|jgi:GPH family glycoside/pentoside/hexuronide:cation symporter